MSRSLDWNRDGRIWPHRSASLFVPSGGATWHVQRMGPAGAPQILLLHGTGASVHSWRDVMPLLAEDHDCIAIDLPRHAFTAGHALDDTSLPRMTTRIAGLLRDIDAAPTAIVGHSAGAAIAIQFALDHGYAGPIVGLNSALRPFPGPAAQVFPALAKALFVNPLVPRIFAATTTLPGEASRFLHRSTGSRLDDTGLTCYSALLRNPHHARGALAMMANWDLPRLKSRLGEAVNPVLLVHSDEDAAIPLDWTREAVGWLPNASLEVLNGLGHLAHEEEPERAAALIRSFTRSQSHKERTA